MPFQKLNLTGSALKLIACCAMFVDHFAKSQELTGPAFVILSDLAGRIAFPLFCLMLAEGFFHTKNIRHYQLRMLIIALLSEVPFDKALWNTAFFRNSQNTCFTLLLGLILFELLLMVQKKGSLSYETSIVIRFALTAAFAAAAQLLHLDYGAQGIAALAVCYFGCEPGTRTLSGSLVRPAQPAVYGQDDPSGESLRAKKRQAALLLACIILNLDGFHNAGAFLALIPAFFYTGRRGRRSRAVQYAFYLFYPAHLLLLALLR